MNIHELDSYNLGDAVKFHRRLNPRIWGRDEQLLPEVRERLLTIAEDFQEFLGVKDLDVEDITISGSNAAYSYTKNSDIDLHIVVTMPDDPVYQELFSAKKYQYNNEHNIKIGGADVELYVQPADQPHISLGIYSVQHNSWISIPQRKRARVDDACVRDKVADLDARIHDAVRSGDQSKMATLADKIKAMRQAGLEQQGEFGCENLAFKILRNSGCIKLLWDARRAAQDRKLSLREAPRQRFRYGFGEGMQSQPYSTSDGVAASTKSFLEDSESDDNIVQDFIKHVTTELGIDPAPEIHLHTDPEWSERNQSFGRYDPESHTLNVSMPNRHVMDVLRTVAHELVHCSQNQQHGQLPDDAGETGSRWENDANARAGIIMRDWANSHPEHFARDSLEEGASGYIPKNKREAAMPQYAMALSVDIKPGQTGKEANKLALNTGRNGEPGLLMKTVNLREDIENFPIANVRRANGAIGTQGVNIEQAADVLTHAAGMQVSPDMSMRQLVDALKADPAAQQRLRQFVQKNPITVSALPDGSYHLQDGHHRTFLLNLLGDETVPAVVKEGVAEGKQPGQPVVDAILKVMPIAQEIWFHGSRATGKHRKNSDTDILVVVPDDLVGDQYLGVVRILQKLSRHFDNHDIQPTHPGYNIHLIAQEEGQLLWSNKQGMAEARKNPDQNKKYGMGKYELAAFAEDIRDQENWGVSMTAEPKLGINPQVGISEDTPKGIYFYPLEYFIQMVNRYQPLPWGDNMPYMQLFQYDRSNEMTQQTQVDPAQLRQALSQYCPEKIIQQVLDEPDSLYDDTPYWMIYDCLSRLGTNDETNIVRWNKVLRDLGFTSVYDPGAGWIAYNEPTQGVVLDPRIIRQHKMFVNRNPKVKARQYDIQELADAIMYNGDYDRERQRQQIRYGDPAEVKARLDVAKSMLRPFLGKTEKQAKEMGLDQAIKTAGEKVIEILRNANKSVTEAALGNVLSWPEVVNKINSAMKATGWNGKREGEDTFLFTAKGQETDDQWYIMLIANQGNGMFSYALGTVEDGDPYLDDAFKDVLPTTDASVSELLNIIRDAFGLHEQGVTENFADGKNPGRKGLAKRSGVNTKASVSSLRKTAKNSSGEKQRMAHWLANMKAGRAKAKRK